jgi:outer membrane protein assembly factor BamD (BamD/ComL family)
MSVSGISTTNLLNIQSNPPAQTSLQKAQAEFQQLGTDLKSGNLSAAQSDYSTLQSLVSQSSYASSVLQDNNPIGNAFTQLGEDLKSGNLSAAQQDYSTIRRDFQNLPHEHHHGGPTPVSPPINQLFEQLGSALQAGDLSTAQQTYSSLTQQLSPDASSTSGLPVSTAPLSLSVSV